MLESLNRPQGRKVFDPMPCSCGKPIPESCRIYGKCPDCYNAVSDAIEDRLDHSRYLKRRKEDQEAADYEKHR